MRALWALCVAGGLLLAQPKPKADDKEMAELEQAMAEAGNSPVEYARVLEKHLRRYPQSAQRKEIERVLLDAAIDLKDKRRLVLYGPPAIDGGNEDVKVLDHVTRALLDNENDKAANEKALGYARKLRDAAAKWLENQQSIAGAGRGRRIDDYENRRARAVLFEARAQGNLGRLEAALQAARQAHQLYATDETAREVARWLERSGKNEEALAYYAEAFAGATAAGRQKDREKLRTLATQTRGSEAGVGELLLAAVDRVQKQTEERIAHVRVLDPNALATLPYEFTLTGLNGAKLALSSLQGKVAVLDFWATWCGPCRQQHPLYEQLRKRYASNPKVVFLSVNADEDRDGVKPFLEQQKWSQDVWFDEGLQSLFRINSIPTTLMLDHNGGVFSRLPGFIPDRFIDMMVERIDEAVAAIQGAGKP